MNTEYDWAPGTLSNALQSAYTTLIELTGDTQFAESCAAGARLALQSEKQRILAEYAADPKALGSNEQAREATLSQMLTPYGEEVSQAEGALTKRKNLLALQQLEVSTFGRSSGYWKSLRVSLWRKGETDEHAKGNPYVHGLSESAAPDKADTMPRLLGRGSLRYEDSLSHWERRSPYHCLP